MFAIVFNFRSDADSIFTRFIDLCTEHDIEIIKPHRSFRRLLATAFAQSENYSKWFRSCLDDLNEIPKEQKRQMERLCVEFKRLHELTARFCRLAEQTHQFWARNEFVAVNFLLFRTSN